jgi:predicted 3-demethylubiquinone-9 3-methyltransferase (glyoxalase superfamily)
MVPRLNRRGCWILYDHLQEFANRLAFADIGHISSGWTEVMALNGGPQFTSTEAISFFVNCETQAEVDELWEKLFAEGEPGRCGWLKDKFGVSWQIIPSILGEMLQDEDEHKSDRVIRAMLQLDKIDIVRLKRAYEGHG